MKPKRPFLDCNATDTDVKELMNKMFFYAFKPDKNGCSSLDGDGFAKSLADFWECEYGNNKAPFDVLVPDGDELIGVEAKKCQNDPCKDGRLRIELSNGTSNAWKHITATTGLKKDKVDPTTDHQARTIGEGFVSYRLDLWKNYRPNKRAVNFQKSVFVAAQVYEKHDKEVCQIYTISMPQFEETATNLNWHFKTVNCLVGSDSAGARIDWYWDNNGIAKYYPTTKDCWLKSPVFSTFSERSDSLCKLLRSSGTEACLRKMRQKNLSLDLIAQVCYVALTEDPRSFAKYIKNM